MARKFMTLSRHILEGERMHPGATGELSALLDQLGLAAKLISLEVNKAGLMDILGFTGDENVHGEQVKKLDMFAHDIMIRALDHTGHFCVMASEEEEDIIHIPAKHKIGKYVLLFDPLDGSSNIDANISIGTIFSIYKRITPDDTPGTLEDCLQPGYKQEAAGYIVYGSSTILVYSTGHHGVHGFTLDPAFGEFILSHEDIKIPEKGRIYSANEGNYLKWPQGVKNYIKYLQSHTFDEKPYQARYVGSMVADLHRTLLYGGIFMYPSDLQHYASGKLRLMYECNPMAFIIETAGGRAIDGKKRILEIQPTKLHERTPVYMGSKEDIDLLEKFLRESEKD